MSMMGRRNLTQAAAPNSLERALRKLGRRVQKIERAPARVPPAQVVEPVGKVAPAETLAVSLVDIFYPGYIYRAGGDSWETLGNSGDASLPGVMVAGIIGKTLYMNPSDGSLWRSTDSGATWTAVLASSDLSMGGDSPIDIGIAPSGTWWALNDTAPAKVYKSSDADTWTEEYEFSGSRGGGDMGALAVSPTDSNRIAALGFESGNCYVVVSTDGGATWGSEVEVSGDCRAGAIMAWYGDTSLVVMIDEPAAGDLERQKIYISTNDGASWSSPLTNTTDLTLVNSARWLYTKTYENGVLVLATDKKAFRTTNGTSFSTINPPLGGGATPRIRGIVLAGGDLYTLTDDGSFYRGSTAKTSPPVAPSGSTTPLVTI